MSELQKLPDTPEDNVTTLSDNLLLERVRGGDIASFDTLFYRHYDRVYGLLFRLLGNRVEAEDLTQEVFLKLHDQAYKQKGFSTQREHNLSAWLYRVATNMGYNAIRGRKRRWQRNTVLLPEKESASNAETAVAQREEVAAVRRTLARLNQRQAQLLLMRQMGFTYAECAAACRVAPGSVGTLLARAAKAFREIYEEEERNKK